MENKELTIFWKIEHKDKHIWSELDTRYATLESAKQAIYNITKDEHGNTHLNYRIAIFWKNILE